MSKRVLVVDDDKDFANALASRIRYLGLEVETASNPLTAMSMIAAHPPDLLCLDVDMPTGNGLEIREFLANDPVCRKTPVLIITGSKADETIQRCSELNANYVHKSPNYWQEVSAHIHRFLDIRDEESDVKSEEVAGV